LRAGTALGLPRANHLAETFATEPLYSDAHPYYVEEDEPATKIPETGLGNPSAEDVAAPADASAPTEAMITQSYMQKGFFFVLLVAVALYLVKRHRSGYGKVDEKSIA